MVARNLIKPILQFLKWETLSRNICCYMMTYILLNIICWEICPKLDEVLKFKKMLFRLIFELKKFKSCFYNEQNIKFISNKQSEMPLLQNFFLSFLSKSVLHQEQQYSRFLIIFVNFMTIMLSIINCRNHVDIQNVRKYRTKKNF